MKRNRRRKKRKKRVTKSTYIYWVKNSLYKSLYQKIKSLLRKKYKEEDTQKQKEIIERQKRIKKEEEKYQKLIKNEEEKGKLYTKIVLSFIEKYGEEEFYQYRRTKKFSNKVYVIDELKLKQIFEGGNRISIKPKTIEELKKPLIKKPYEFAILNEIEKFGNILVEKSVFKPVYICNGIKFIIVNFSRYKCRYISHMAIICLKSKPDFDYCIGRIETGEIVCGLYKKKHVKTWSRSFYRKEDLFTLEEIFGRDNKNKIKEF